MSGILIKCLQHLCFTSNLVILHCIVSQSVNFCLELLCLWQFIPTSLVCYPTPYKNSILRWYYQCRCHAESFMSIIHCHCYFVSFVQIWLIIIEQVVTSVRQYVSISSKEQNLSPSVMQDIILYSKGCIVLYYIIVFLTGLASYLLLWSSCKMFYFSCLFMACTAKHVRMNILYLKIWWCYELFIIIYSLFQHTGFMKSLVMCCRCISRIMLNGGVSWVWKLVYMLNRMSEEWL